MKNVLMGTIAGLALGTIGALAYSHYLGDGRLIADLQSQLDAANANLAKTTTDKQQLATETSGASDQVDQLVKSNEDLKKQVDELKNAAPATPAAVPAVNPVVALAGMMRGGFQTQQRLFLLQARLHLTPEQAARIKAAMDADATARRDLMRQMFRDNGKVDPQAAAAANTLDQALAAVLTPQQQAAYQQVVADEKASRAETMASVQMNQIAPLLQLSDSQKDQVASALYQVQVAAPDPTNLMTNPNAASVMAAQAQATQAALAKVLTPDQLALYNQQPQPSFGGGRRGNGGGGGNGGGAADPNSAGGAGTSAGSTTAVLTTTTVPPPVVNTPNGMSNAATTAPATPATNAPASDSSSTNTASAATTNAAPAQ